MISAEPGAGPRPELIASLVLQRARGDGVAKLDENYWDRGLPTPGRLAEAFDALTAAGLPASADPDSYGLRRITLTTAGHARYEQLSGAPRPPGLPVPDPQFPALTTSARERLSGPGSGQSDPHRRGNSSVGSLRWARRPDDGRLHLLAPAEVMVAASGGHAEAVCMACMDGIPSHPGPRGSS